MVINYSGVKVFACETVVEEMLPLLPPQIKYETLDFGLHINPDVLKIRLQSAIDNVPPDIQIIILGYGMCSQAVIGLKSGRCTLVIPRVDDCIAMFLGSAAARREQNRISPGTYYLTKGWIEAGDSPFDEYGSLAEKYGPDKARRILNQMFNHYTRLVFINTGPYDVDKYRVRSRETAENFGLDYEEIAGSKTLIRKMLSGNWDDDFVVVKPGGSVSLKDFMRD